MNHEKTTHCYTFEKAETNENSQDVAKQSSNIHLMILTSFLFYGGRNCLLFFFFILTILFWGVNCKYLKSLPKSDWKVSNTRHRVRTI